MPDEDQQGEDTSLSEEEPLISLSEVVGLKVPEPVDQTYSDPSEYISEKDLSPYERWVADPSQDNLYKATQSLKPTIDSVLASMGAAGNPQLLAKAKVVAAKAIQKYDPSAGASLPTYVTNQLRQLARDKRKSDSPIPMPDGVQLDAYAIYKAETELEDELGRDPSVEEIADRCHLSVKRIGDVRTKMRAVSNEGAFESEDGETGLQGKPSDFSQEATEYIYNESDLTDKKIIEYTLGYGGAEQLDNKALMAKLKLTPVQLSRRRARISMRIGDIMRDLETL